MKQATIRVLRNGQIAIPAELVRQARVTASTSLSCGWTEGAVVLASAPNLAQLGTFRAVVRCPIRPDGTIHLPYRAGRALRVRPNDGLSLQVKTGQIGVTP